jgi:hypothetical protein
MWEQAAHRATRIGFIVVFMGCHVPNPPPPPPEPAPPGPITAEQALEIARKTVAGIEGGSEYVILEDQTVEKPFGWVFSYAPKKYVETKDMKYLRPGDGPLVVQREDGTTFFVSTSVPPNVAIAEIELRWREKLPLH